MAFAFGRSNILPTGVPGGASGDLGRLVVPLGLFSQPSSFSFLRLCTSWRLLFSPAASDEGGDGREPLRESDAVLPGLCEIAFFPAHASVLFRLRSASSALFSVQGGGLDFGFSEGANLTPFGAHLTVDPC